MMRGGPYMGQQQQGGDYMAAQMAAAAAAAAQQQQQQQQQGLYGAGAMGMGGVGVAQGSCVVMVGGLPKSDEHVVHIFNLMSFWGNVKVVKFLTKKENVAMVEYSGPDEAHNAYTMCRGCACFGHNIQVSTSKFPSIQHSPNDQFCKDFSALRLWRYPQGSRSQQYLNAICHPATKLHLAYLHGYTEGAVYEMFATVGTVITVNFMSDNPTMGFVTMSSVGEACTAVCVFHNRPNPSDPNQRPLKVSFAKK